jgi:hypothetical protein
MHHCRLIFLLYVGATSSSSSIASPKVCKLLVPYMSYGSISTNESPIKDPASRNPSRSRSYKPTRIKVEDKLGFFLYMINHNASFEDLQVFFGHSNDTIHRVIKHFFNIVIPALSMQFLKLPTIEVHPKIHGNNKFYPYIKAISFLVLMC